MKKRHAFIISVGDSSHNNTTTAPTLLLVASVLKQKATCALIQLFLYHKLQRCDEKHCDGRLALMVAALQRGSVTLSKSQTERERETKIGRRGRR